MTISLIQVFLSHSVFWILWQELGFRLLHLQVSKLNNVVFFETFVVNLMMNMGFINLPMNRVLGS